MRFDLATLDFPYASEKVVPKALTKEEAKICCLARRALELESDLPGSRRGSVTKLEDIKSSREGARIFEAKLSLEGQAEPKDVVCKVAYNENEATALLEEARCYEVSLRNLQGRVVPIFYGVFEGETGDGEIKVLLMEYCGESVMPQDFQRHKAEVRQAILEALLELHKAGVQHFLSLRFGDIVMHPRDQKPRLIDFGSCVAHKCEAPWHEPFKGYQASLHQCHQVENFCREAGIWCPFSETDIIDDVTKDRAEKKSKGLIDCFNTWFTDSAENVETMAQ